MTSSHPLAVASAVGLLSPGQRLVWLKLGVGSHLSRCRLCLSSSSFFKVKKGHAAF